MGNRKLLHITSELGGKPLRLYIDLSPEAEQELINVLKENPGMDQLKALTIAIERLPAKETGEDENNPDDTQSEE
jgi:hypothetical protein